MHSNPPSPRTFIVAVSGGVDSMVLLHVLHEQNQAHGNWRLIVAHLDHGIRPDSTADRQLVQQTAAVYGLPFVYEEARLGVDASEATARSARYAFLRTVQRQSNADAIITAHHQDDVLETALINLARGTGRKGLTALASRADLQRPLLDARKHELLTYAREHGIAWREDSTNQDAKYLRNHVRHHILARIDPNSRQQLLTIIAEARSRNQEIDSLLNELLVTFVHNGRMDRTWFSGLPHAVAREVMARWLRSAGLRSIDTPLLERLVVAAKVGAAGSQADIYGGSSLTIWQDDLALRLPER